MPLPIWTSESSGPPGAVSSPLRATKRRPERFGFGDELFRRICQAGAFLVVILAALLVIVLVQQSWLAITTIGARFFTHTTWDPVHKVFGAGAFIYGTIATSAIAMLIAVPLGVGTACFLTEIAPSWLRRMGSFFVEMLAAVPSVVYGFWGLIVLAPMMQRIFTFLGGPNQGGIGILSAGLILSIMIVPYVAAVSFDVCQAVPRSQREASYALGATRWQTIWSVVLPYARPGIIGGCFLALGRALGETMAVTMLIGNRSEISFSPFAMGNSIPSVIANQFNEADYDLYLSTLVELGLVLMLVSITVNSLARVLIWRMGRPATGGKSFWRRLRTQRTAQRNGTAGSFSAVAENGAAVHSSPVRPAVSGRHSTVNLLMTVALGACLVITVGFLFVIFGYLLVEGVSSLDWNFFTKLPAPVGETGGGLAHAIYGSFVLVGLATLFAVPIGLCAAIYLAEFRSRILGPTVRFIGELLGGVPSIVIGIFGYYLIVKPVVGHFSGWAGSFALGVMMVPIVMRASEEALRLVPQSIRLASYALGACHYQTVLRVILPAALPAVVTAVMLGIARVVGETAPLLLTSLNNDYWPSSPSEQMPSLPYYIFQYAMSPYEDWHRQGWAAALVLLTIVMLLNVGVRLVTGQRLVSASRAD